MRSESSVLLHSGIRDDVCLEYPVTLIEQDGDQVIENVSFKIPNGA